MVSKYAPHAATSKTRALGWVGRKYAVGWCLRWVAVEVFGVPGVGDWDHDGSADAEDFYKAAVAKGKFIAQTNPAKIPAGVMILWTGGSHDHGHAAYSLGSGMMVSTDLPHAGTVGKVKIDTVRTSWGLTLRGYVLQDANGYLYLKPKTTPKTTKYLVTAKTGLKGHSSPSTSAKVVKVLKHGQTLQVEKLEQVTGRVWALAKGVYYAAEYLKKV